jgi:type II secretory pathway predicted ATPase ExeA
MVLDFHKLEELPFSNAPDPRYLYASETHREALASLLYGVKSGCGFVAMIAKPGMGKTTLLFQALDQLRDKATTVFLFQTMCTPHEFMRAILVDLGVKDTQGTLFELQVRFNDFLVEQARSGKPVILVIDEAQNLDDSVLELVRMLSNFQISTGQFLQIVLSGQLQLAEKLASPGLVQLRQRIPIVARLKPFTEQETALYIEHRLQTAGYPQSGSLFTREAVELIAGCSEGIPRNINNLCFNALSLGCALKRKVIDADIIREVIVDLDIKPLQESPAPLPDIKRPSDVPAAAITRKPSSRPALPLMRIAAGCAVLIAVFVFFQIVRQTATAPIAVRANSADHPIAPPAAAFEKSTLPVSSTVLVRTGQTLNSICTERFGTCTPELLQQILRFNPSIADPNVIQDGQTLRLPAGLDSANDAQNSRELADQSQSVKRGK